MRKLLLLTFTFAFLSLTAVSQNTNRNQDILIVIPAFNSEKSMDAVKAELKKFPGIEIVNFYNTQSTFHYRIDRNAYPDNSIFQNIFADFYFEIVGEQETARLLDLYLTNK
jgi:hypothetical protein